MNDPKASSTSPAIDESWEDVFRESEPSNEAPLATPVEPLGRANPHRATCRACGELLRVIPLFTSLTRYCPKCEP